MNQNLQQLFEKNYNALCNYATGMINDSHAAEDVVQSVFIQIWEKGKLLELKNPSAYLLKSVRYKCIDYLKGKKRKNEVLFDQLPEIGKEEIVALKEEEIEPLLNYFIAKLPPKMRRVFLLSRQQGLTYKEIAATLNVSPKTVENQMGTALKKLRILLQEHHYLPALVLFLQ